MEKKTIGKFIAVLRRANGMTQTQLAEKLFVSDKTVSRWERDESTPDLALIPIIADLFGVTTDELLRGERRARTEALMGADEQKESEEKISEEAERILRECDERIGKGKRALPHALLCFLIGAGIFALTVFLAFLCVQFSM